MATAKFGALSVAKGKVRIEWSRAADGWVVLRWIEAEGPPVNPPTLETMIRGGVEGGVQFDWHAEGLACEIAVPNVTRQSIRDSSGKPAPVRGWSSAVSPTSWRKQLQGCEWKKVVSLRLVARYLYLGRF